MYTVQHRIFRIVKNVTNKLSNHCSVVEILNEDHSQNKYQQLHWDCWQVSHHFLTDNTCIRQSQISWRFRTNRYCGSTENRACFAERIYSNQASQTVEFQNISEERQWLSQKPWINVKCSNVFLDSHPFQNQFKICRQVKLHPVTTVALRLCLQTHRHLHNLGL